MTTDFTSCSTNATRHFLRGQPVAATCRRGNPFLPALPPDPVRLSQLPAVKVLKGIRGKVITATQLTLFDVQLQFLEGLLSSDANTLKGAGLRGGTWRLKLTKKSGRLALHHVEYMPGIRVDGGIVKLGTKKERTEVRISGPRTPDGVIRIDRKWLSGRIGGKAFRHRVSASSGSASAAGYAPAVTRDQLIREFTKRVRELRRRLG